MAQVCVCVCKGFCTQMSYFIMYFVWFSQTDGPHKGLNGFVNKNKKKTKKKAPKSFLSITEVFH